jgi:hypothetical protein
MQLPPTRASPQVSASTIEIDHAVTDAHVVHDRFEEGVIDLGWGGLTRRASGNGVLSHLAIQPASRPTKVRDVNRLAALTILTAAFAPAAVMGALPMVISILAVLTSCWFLLAAWSSTAEAAVEPPVTPIV